MVPVMDMCLTLRYLRRMHLFHSYKVAFSDRASLIAQLVKDPPAAQETQVQFLGREDPLEKEMATHSSSLAWRIPRTEEPGRLQFMGLQELDTT